MVEIKTLEIKELEVFTKLKESQLYHYNEPDLGLFVAESSNVILRALDNGYEMETLLVEDKFLDSENFKLILNKANPKEIYYGSYDVLRNITGYNLTSGVLACFKRRELLKIEDILTTSKRVVVLENVENPTNLGSIFRNSAALNMDGILLSNDCCDPLYKRCSRVSVGNVFNIPYCYIDNIEDCKKFGFKTVGMALRKNTIDINEDVLKKEEKLAILLGNEAQGLKEETIDNCDYVVRIPMSHNVDSLNVASASAIALWELGKRK